MVQAGPYTVRVGLESEPARVGAPLEFSLHSEEGGEAAERGLGAVVEQAGAAVC